MNFSDGENLVSISFDVITCVKIYLHLTLTILIKIQLQTLETGRIKLHVTMSDNTNNNKLIVKIRHILTGMTPTSIMMIYTPMLLSILYIYI